MSRSTRLRHGLTLLLTTTTIVAATGCGGGGDDDPKPSKAAAVQAQMVKFAKCMRDHGVDMPDPKVSGDGRRVTMMRRDDGSDTGPGQMDKAFEACKKFQPKAPAMSAEQRQAANDRALKHAKCMREHGVDMPDPKPGSPMKLAVKPNDSTFEAAMKACGESGGPMLTAAPAQ